MYWIGRKTPRGGMLHRVFPSVHEAPERVFTQRWDTSAPGAPPWRLLKHWSYRIALKRAKLQMHYKTNTIPNTQRNMKNVTKLKNSNSFFLSIRGERRELTHPIPWWTPFLELPAPWEYCWAAQCSIAYFALSQVRRAGRWPLLIDTYSTQIIWEKSIALHAAKIIRNQLFLILPMVRSENAWISTLQQIEKHALFSSKNNKTPKSNNISVWEPLYLTDPIHSTERYNNHNGFHYINLFPIVHPVCLLHGSCRGSAGRALARFG